MKYVLVIIGVFTSLLAFQSQFSLTFSPDQLKFKTLSNYDFVVYGDFSMSNDVGKPSIPSGILHVALPEGMRAIDIELIRTEDETLHQFFNLLPVQPPRKINEKKRAVIQPPGDTYYENIVYPEKPVEIIGNGDIAGQNLCALKVYPISYVPEEGKIILHKVLEFRIITEKGREPRKIRLTNLSRSLYETQIKNMVLNPQDVHLKSSAPSGSKLDPGDYDYVIITTSSLSYYWDSLLTWKKKKGLKDTLVTVNWIYGAYSGSDNAEKIRNFVIDANSTWGTVWFVIGGDADQIPMKTKSFYVNSTWYDVPSDFYYADYDDDWYQEVYVGRIPADNYTQINIFANKLIKYEVDPPVANYPLKILFIGMDLDDYTQSETLKDNIDNYYVPSRFSITKVYDSDASNHKTDAINALNSGQNIVNHSDHSDWDQLGVGSYNHGWALYSSDIDNLTNTNKTCIFYSLGCWSNAFDYSDAISEHFIVYNASQAGVAYIGNTRYGWYNSGYYNSLSMKMDMEWWKSLFTYNKYNVGVTLADSKNRNYPSDDGEKYIHYELCLLGDPQMPIWTDTPGTLTVTYADTIAAWPSDFTVTVTHNGSPVENAYVCLYKDNEVYERDYTNASGQVVFSINPTTEGVMFVTVTKQDYLPHLGFSVVTSGPPVADFTADPTTGPTPLTVSFTDLSTGGITSWHWFFGDGEESYEHNPTHIYTEEGSFDVTLIVSGPAGADTAIKTDYINVVCDNVMLPETVLAYPGGHFRLQILAETNVPTQAFQMGSCFDPNYIQIDSVNYSNTVFDTAWGGSGPEYLNPYIDNDTGNFQVACVFDMTPPLEKKLNPMNQEPILSIYFTTKETVTPPDTTYFTLSDDCGLNIYTDTVPQSVHPCLFKGPIIVINEPLFIRGDANTDSYVDISDVTYILNHLFPSPVFSCMDAADCDDNGSVDITDATYLLSHIFPNPSLPAPCPNCGVDPTSDSLNCESYPPCGTMLNVVPPTLKGNKAYLKFVFEENETKINLEIMNSADVAAFQFRLNYDGAVLKDYNFSEDVKSFGILDSYTEDGMIILYGIYGLTPYASGMPILKRGYHKIASLTFVGDDPDIKMDNAVIATPDGTNLNPSILYILDNENKISDFALFNAVPNPANKMVKLGFAIPQKGKVTLTIYNTIGQKVVKLVDGTLEKGEHFVQWDFRDTFGRRVSNGIYFYELQWNGRKALKKFMINK